MISILFSLRSSLLTLSVLPYQLITDLHLKNEPALGATKCNGGLLPDSIDIHLMRHDLGKVGEGTPADILVPINKVRGNWVKEDIAWGLIKDFDAYKLD
jgi:hypothetical protein